MRDAIEHLAAERIGHGIAAIRDPYLMNWLASRAIPLEICPVSNLRTGALARQLRRDPASSISLKNHPLPQLLRAGIPITLSTDDPAMFETTLGAEYAGLAEMDLTRVEVLSIAETAFAAAFLPAPEKERLSATFRQAAAALALS